MIIYYNPFPKKDYFSIICSFLMHIALLTAFILFLFISHSQNFINLNVKNQGAVEVKLVPHITKTPANNRQSNTFKVVKNSSYKNTVKKSPPSKLNLKSQPVRGSGGVGRSGSKILPVLNNQKLLKYQPPSYPLKALRLKQQGTVVVRLLVNNKQVLGNMLYKSSGYELLDNAVIRAVKFWRLKEDIHQKAWLEVRVNFILQ